MRFDTQYRLLLLVFDPSMHGSRAANRICKPVIELALPIQNKALVMNRFNDNDNQDFMTNLSCPDVDFWGYIPNDPNVVEYDVKGIPLIDLPADSPALVSATAILDKLQVL